MLKRCSKS